MSVALSTVSHPRCPHPLPAPHSLQTCAIACQAEYDLHPVFQEVDCKSMHPREDVGSEIPGAHLEILSSRYHLKVLTALCNGSREDQRGKLYLWRYSN